MSNIKSPNPFKNTNYNKSARKPEVVTTIIDWGGRYFAACAETVDQADTPEAHEKRMKAGQRRLRLSSAFRASPLVIDHGQSIDDDDE